MRSYQFKVTGMFKFFAVFMVMQALIRLDLLGESESKVRVEVFEANKHEQERVTSYPYDEEEVFFVNQADGVRLAGTLTLPRGQGPFPAVILLHGSAPLDRDCSMFGHKFFLVWADYFTRQGIAVLRFDKRSAGKSTGNYATATIKDFALDALAGIEYLKSRQKINRLGLIGHSEGGMTAVLAASQSQDVVFVISLAGPCVNWESMMKEQVALLQRSEGLPEETVLLSQQLLQQIFTVLKIQPNRDEAAVELREVLSKNLSRFAMDQRAAFEACYGTIDQQIHLFNSVWFRFSLTYDPVVVLQRVTSPILALFAELDTNVSSKQSMPLFAKALEEAGHRDYKIMELPQLNHGFQTCLTGSPREYATIEETASPLALKIIADWIVEKTQ